VKFDYAYRDKENVRHDGTVVASSKDDAFKKLRAQGVKPFFVARSPGAWNFLLSFGKRGLAIAVLAVIAVAGVAVSLSLTRTIERVEESAVAPLTRRQIYGDPALMEKMELDGYVEVFAAAGDRVLARFAQPAKVTQYMASLRRDATVRREAVAALEELKSCLGRKAAASFEPKESREMQELQRIVEWMHGEYAGYLANGRGTPNSYLRRLIERQIQEAQIVTRTKNELENEKDPAVWEKRNNELRSIGAPTIPMPAENDRE